MSTKKHTVKLPAWATLADHTDERLCIVDIDAEAAYKEWLALLEARYPGKVKHDQYWLQCAHECIKLDVQLALAGSEKDPRVSGLVAQLHISSAPDYAQAGKPAGRGPDAASKGEEARRHFAAIRGAAALQLAAE